LQRVSSECCLYSVDHRNNDYNPTKTCITRTNSCNMERDFYNEDIEQLIKQKADQYKMYPSDKVWKGIQRSLHPRRKWYWFSFVLFLGAISYYTIMEMVAPSRNASVATAKNPSAKSPTSAQQDKQAVVIPFVTTGREQEGKGPMAKKHFTDLVETQTNNNRESPAAHAPGNTYTFDNVPSLSREASVIDFRTGRLKEELVSSAPADKMALASENENALSPGISEPLTDPAAGVSFEKTLSAEANEDSKSINWLQESAAYRLPVQKPQRLSWQLSFSPTMNYRKLDGSKYRRIHSDVKNVPIALNIQGDPDNLVRHKPALGLELGSHFIYSLNKTFAVKAGLQFNYSRYDIQAYTSNVKEPATIALDRTSGALGDSITNYTNLRNFSGDAVQELQNQYFQFSIPLGIEWRLLGNDKLQLGVAGTIQPTYLINRNTYLITTDFKNYTQEPSLLRKWNLNTSAEAFIAYKTGDLKWQVGPQFRYQLLSSYIKEYPITEHLMEFGIKIGVAKTIR
jgi:hypothetical protein